MMRNLHRLREIDLATIIPFTLTSYPSSDHLKNYLNSEDFAIQNFTDYFYGGKAYHVSG